MDNTITLNIKDRGEVMRQVAKKLTEYDPILLELETDKAMQEYDFEIYVV